MGHSLFSLLVVTLSVCVEPKLQQALTFPLELTHESLSKSTGNSNVLRPYGFSVIHVDITLSAMLFPWVLSILSKHFVSDYIMSAHLWGSCQPSRLCSCHKWYICATLTLFQDFMMSAAGPRFLGLAIIAFWNMTFCCGGCAVRGGMCGLCQ